MNDKQELLQRISSVILGHAAYNTVFESIKYENVIPEHKVEYNYKWTPNETDNIISIKNSEPIDCAASIGRVSSLLFDVEFFYYIENNSWSQLDIQITNITSNYENNGVLINDFINNIVQNLITGTYGVIDGREYIALDQNEAKSKIDLADSIKVVVGFKKDDGSPLSIRSLFINDLTLKYGVTEKQGLVGEIKQYSSSIAQSVQFILDNNDTEVEDVYEQVIKSESVNANALTATYKEVEDVTNSKDFLYNTILHKIQRSGLASVADMLTLCDGSDIELNYIQYIVYL